jgi:hypothetical protein
MTDNRTNILQKILNLRAKAEGGASEAEAMACLEKADKLMHSYRIEEAELALAESAGQIKVEIVTRRYMNLTTGDGGYRRRGNRHSAELCAGPIAQFTGTKVVFYDSGRSAEFLGDKVDVELAIFLLDLVKNSMDRAYTDWRAGQGATGYGAKKSFQFGMARRLNERLRDMTEERRAERKEAQKMEAKRLAVDPSVLETMVAEGNMPELTNTAMVLIVADAAKERQIAEEYTKQYPKLGKLGGLRGGSNYGAGMAGRKAADRVHLGRVIGSNKNTRIAC